MDNKTTEERSRNMSKIRSTNTQPELIVRKALHQLGFRFRLHAKDLPGKPDLVLPKYKAVIFINGCFWHGHEGCSRYVLPKSNEEYWHNKIRRNIFRDKENIRILNELGWKCLVVWECSLKKTIREQTIKRIVEWLKSCDANDSI